jgi:hypothetical protein
MNRKRRFWRETAIYYGLATGLLMVGCGIELIVQVPRITRGFGWNALNAWTTFGEFVVVAGAILSVISVLLGLSIAFGVGPDFLARVLRDAVIDEKLETLSDGSPVFNDTPEDISLKHYFRLRLSDGEVLEVQCKKELFHSHNRGTQGIARVIGGRLVSFSTSSSARK